MTETSGDDPRPWVATCGLCGQDWAFDSREERQAWRVKHPPEHIDFVTFSRAVPEFRDDA